MQKKPVQISSTTLGLRFMQNAARAKQEKEVEAAKAKVKSEEEWEIAPPSGKSWLSATEQQSVTYEPSYLPFLFSGRSDGPSSTGNGNHFKFTKDDGTETESAPLVSIKGRRTFGKSGKEEKQEDAQSETVPPLPPVDGSSFPRGARAISSHGRSAALPSKSFRPPKVRPAPPPLQQPVQQPARVSSTTGPPGFMKPQVASPRTDGGDHGKKRVVDTESVVDGRRKKKKRKEKEV